MRLADEECSMADRNTPDTSPSDKVVTDALNSFDQGGGNEDPIGARKNNKQNNLASKVFIRTSIKEAADARTIDQGPVTDVTTPLSGQVPCKPPTEQREAKGTQCVGDPTDAAKVFLSSPNDNQTSLPAREHQQHHEELASCTGLTAPSASVYNSVIGHGSTGGEAPTSQQSSETSGATAPHCETPTLMDSVQNTIIAARERRPTESYNGGINETNIIEPKPEADAFDLYELLPSAKVPSSHARDMPLNDEGPVAPIHQSMPSHSYSINETSIDNISTIIGTSPSSEDRKTSLDGSAGLLESTDDLSRCLSSQAVSVSTPIHSPGSPSQQPHHEREQDQSMTESSLSDLRKLGQALTSPEGSVNRGRRISVSSQHTYGSSSREQCASSSPYRSLESSADAHFPDRSPTMLSLADAASQGQDHSPYNSLSSGTPSGVKIERSPQNHLAIKRR
jgi:hypothetical protein